MRRWTSPVAGAAEIRARLAKADANSAGTGVFARIYQNGTLIHEVYAGPRDHAGTDYMAPVRLQTGDVFDFAVAANGPDSYASTTFEISILTISPPSGKP